MCNKKSTAMVDFLIYLALGLFIVFVLAVLVPRLIGKSGTEASSLLSATKDYDGDGIADFYDKCACEYGEERNDGCPVGMETKGETAIIREKECKKKITS